MDQSGVGGIAWYVDRAADRVVVTADSTVSAAEVATIKQSAGANAGAIRIKHVRRYVPAAAVGRGRHLRRPVPLLARLQRGQRKHLLLPHRRALREGRQDLVHQPGHTTLIGPTVSYSFPGNDYALVRYDNTSLSHPGGFTVADAFVGERSRAGSTTGTHTGTVTALNVSVRYSGVARHRQRHDPDHRVCRAGRLRRPAL